MSPLKLTVEYCIFYHFSVNIYLAPPPEGLRSIAMNVSVRLSSRMSQKSHVQTARNFLHMLPVTVARSSSDDNAIRYVHNRPGKSDANRASTQSDSPGGSTGDEV